MARILSVPYLRLFSLTVTYPEIEVKFRAPRHKAIEARIEQLMPAFKAACASFQMDRIELERATIGKRLTPGQWNYSASILEQEALLKQLKQQFQITHEPCGGREITWTLKLLS